MCEKLGHWRDSNPRPPYPRRRVSILVTNVLTTRPQKPLILLQRQITNIHTLPFLSSFVLGVLVIFKPQVCIVSTAQVHIPSRYTHTKCSPFWSDVPTCTFLNSRVSLTRLISHYGYASLGFEMIIEYLRWEGFVTLYIWKLRMNLEIFNSKFDSTNSTLKMCEKLGHWRDSNPRPPYPRRRVSILVTNVLTTRPQRPLILLQISAIDTVW